MSAPGQIENSANPRRNLSEPPVLPDLRPRAQGTQFLHHDLPDGWPDQQIQAAQQSGFSGARRSHQHTEFAAPEPQRRGLQRDDRTPGAYADII